MDLDLVISSLTTLETSIWNVNISPYDNQRSHVDHNNPHSLQFLAIRTLLQTLVVKLRHLDGTADLATPTPVSASSNNPNIPSCPIVIFSQTTSFNSHSTSTTRLHVDNTATLSTSSTNIFSQLPILDLDINSYRRSLSLKHPPLPTLFELSNIDTRVPPIDDPRLRTPLSANHIGSRVLPAFFGSIPVHACNNPSENVTPLVMHTFTTPSIIDIDSDTVATSLEKLPRRSNSREMRSVSSSHIPEPLSCISGTASTGVVVDIESLDSKVIYYY